MNHMDWNIAYFYLLLIDAAILIGILIYTWHHLAAKGARQLFEIVLFLFGFNLLYFATLFTRSAYAKQHLMYFVYACILMTPIAWLSLVLELTDTPKRRKWQTLIPMMVINTLGYLSIVFPIAGFDAPVRYYGCSVYWQINLCMIEYTSWFWIVMGTALLEVVYGLFYVVRFMFKPENRASRQRFWLVIVSVVVFAGVLVAVAALFNDVAGADPLPVAFAVFGVLLFIAIYFQKVFKFMPEEEMPVQPVDDLLLVIDSDHFILDVNMSCLQVFDLDVNQVIDVQLEHALMDYPQIIELFSEGNASQSIDLAIDGVIHTFEPSLVKIREPQSNTITGLRLQLRDVSEQNAPASTEMALGVARDPLTNLYNKQSLFQFGEKLIQNTRRMRQSLVLAVIDIDDFHSVNQRFSHLVGDQALIQLVDIINNMIRASDLLARLESDELVLILPKADEFSAFQICSRIKDAVATHHFTFYNQEFQITISLGYTLLEGNAEATLDDMLSVAYVALTQSHALGRNRLTFLPMDRTSRDYI
jgi:diguanylate cyclase (GGDEF)-like protein